MTSESGWLNDQGELCLRAARALEERNSVAAGSQKFSMGMGLQNSSCRVQMNRVGS